MKKILLIITLALLTSALLAQKKSNYEIYWQAREDSITKSQTTLSQDTTEKQIISAKLEYDDLYYQPSKDAKKVKRVKKDNIDILIDTLVKENPNIVINYYDADPFFYSHNIGRFYHGGFNYWMYGNPWYYNNYWMFDTYDWYWEMRFMRNSYWCSPWYYNSFYFGYNNWWHRPYYIHNNYNHYNNFYGYNQQSKQNIQFGRRETYSTLTNNQPNNRRVAPVQQSQEKRTVGTQNKATYQESRRATTTAYTPSYTQPRTNIKPDYNNSKAISTIPQRRIETSAPNVQRSTQSRTQTGNYSQPSIQRRVETSTQSRTYSVPTRSSSSNYSQPSRSYSQPSNNYNSGSNVGRSSSGSNFSNSSNSGGSTGNSNSGASGTRR